MVYVYGNANDIDITSTMSATNGAMHPDAANVKLEISGITAPYANINSYTWNVKTMRFQTKTILSENTTSGTGITTTTNAIGTTQYKNSWNVAQALIANGATMFMDVSVNFNSVIYNT